MRNDTLTVVTFAAPPDVRGSDSSNTYDYFFPSIANTSLRLVTYSTPLDATGVV